MHHMSGFYRWVACASLGCTIAGLGSVAHGQTAGKGLPQKAGTTNPASASDLNLAPGTELPGPGPRGFANDSCSTPQVIVGTGVFPFNSVNATTGGEGQRVQSCSDAGSPAGIHNDEWFCWTATCTGIVEIHTCGQTQADTKIALWRGCNCPRDGEEPLCCNDNSCNRQSRLRCDVVCGERYMIQIGSAPGTPPGSGTFTITCSGEPCGGGGEIECPLPECCGRKPTYSDRAYSTFTGQVMAMTAETFVASGIYSLTVFDISGYASAITAPAEWNPPNFRYNDPRWTKVNLGSLFGVTLDDSGNIYAAHGTLYNGSDPIGALAGSTAGSVYKIANTTGTPTVFVNLPNNGPGIGNVSWDCDNSQIFASNFEDGRIYRVSATGAFLSAYDHATGAVTPAVLGVIANEAGEPNNQYVPLGERVWAVRHQNDKVYFSLWNRDGRNINDMSSPLPPNQIWSIKLDGAGEFIAGTAILETNVPGHGGVAFSQPVSDISFSQSTPAKMLLAERSMYTDTSGGAHDARLLEMECRDGWTLFVPANSNPNDLAGGTYGFCVGDFASMTNSAGGADYDVDPSDPNGGRVWVSADALAYTGSVPFIYGGTGMLPVGSTPTNGIFFDFNNDVTVGDKTQLGDIVIACREACASFSDVVVRCNLSADGVPDGTYTVTYTITNNSGSPIHYVLLPNAPTTPHVIHLPVPLPVGSSTSISITLTGVAGNTQYCFDMIFTDERMQDCCTAELCIDVPACDCIQADRVRIECDPAGGYVLNFNFTNFTPDQLAYLFVAPSGGATVTPDFVPLPLIPPGGTFVMPPLTIGNVSPGDRVCFLISVHNDHLMECCSIVICVTIPPPCSVDPCSPDFNHDGSLNSQDFFDFLVAFFADEASADFNSTGSINSQDFFDFMAAFFTGC
ncbi:MAG: hypothetical protein H7210_01725 [Pyrinomonadaceae bacterium]|nr:hypothetical protein [Phycisphaerales bacterium]